MVLDVRKMEVGETKLKLQAYPFNSWIKEIGADFTDEGAAQEVQIDYQLDDSIKEVVFDKGYVYNRSHKLIDERTETQS